MRILVLVLALSPIEILADEGMWTFDNPPSAKIQDAYGFQITKDWLLHAQLASLRFNDGGSGSFVSDQGLVLTNHHVAFGQLQKMSTPEANYVKDGFYACSQKEERKCPDLELNQLRSYEEVTRAVTVAMEKAEGEAAKNKARRAAIAKITKDCTDKTGLRCDVVTLYNGGEYWLYRYKKYTDIRLVMAPEVSAAFFGGDLDNFTYPRFALDYAFFRVYENGVPVRPEKYFRWNEKGPKEGELTFVTGHPGRTDRQLTVAQLEFARDHALPHALRSAKRRIGVLKEYMARGEEEHRRAKGTRFGTENYFKARTGMLAGLQDPAVFQKKIEEEQTLRASVKLGSWEKIADAVTEQKKNHPREAMIRNYDYRAHLLSQWGSQIIRYTTEVEKPDVERYQEFQDAKLESLRFLLLSEAPTYPDLEEVLLADKLAEYRDVLGADDPFVRDALQGREPSAVAKEAVSGTRLGDPSFRKSLIERGAKAVEASRDPLLSLLKRLETHYRETRDWYEDKIESVEQVAGRKIADARFGLYGKKIYPDATFTLRLSYGVPRSYMLNTTMVPWKTVFSGLHARAEAFDNKEPYRMSPRVEKNFDCLSDSVPINFVTTHDITGGNSGSPVVDKDLRLVGLIFDGNIQSLSNEYVYSDTVARAVSVHAGGILHSLEKIYRMRRLGKELRRAADR